MNMDRRYKEARYRAKEFVKVLDQLASRYQVELDVDYDRSILVVDKRLAKTLGRIAIEKDPFELVPAYSE